MTQDRLSLGAWGEREAETFLRRRGMKIVTRNFRAPVGEIDIVARHRKQLVFAEVKTRRGTAFGMPQEAVGYRKQQQIIRTAQWFLQQNPKMAGLQPRFDVLAILCQSDGTAQVTHLEDAFSLPD